LTWSLKPGRLPRPSSRTVTSASAQPSLNRPGNFLRGTSEEDTVNQTVTRTLRKLGQAALFSAVRAAAAATGTGIITTIIWRIHH
jgi:hypothetical protein